MLAERMKKIVLAIAATLFTVSVSGFAAGSFDYKTELVPILKRQADIKWFIDHNFRVDASGSANRIGNEVNPRLGGKRVGPYHIRAQSTAFKKLFWYNLTIHTDQRYLDADGNESTLQEAAQVEETFKSLEISRVKFANE